MLTYELFNTRSGGFGYVIKDNDQPWIVQEDTPGAEGVVPMTAEEATAYAEAFIAERQAV